MYKLLKAWIQFHPSRRIKRHEVLKATANMSVHTIALILSPIKIHFNISNRQSLINRPFNQWFFFFFLGGGDRLKSIELKWGGSACVFNLSRFWANEILALIACIGGPLCSHVVFISDVSMCNNNTLACLRENGESLQFVTKTNKHVWFSSKEAIKLATKMHVYRHMFFNPDN